MDLDCMLPAFELGASLGAPYVLVLANDPDFQRMADNLGTLAEAAGRFGLTVALEAPHTRIQLKTLPRALEIVAAAGADNVVLVLDTNQFGLAGHDLALLRRQDPRLFPYAQLTDATAEGVACVPGEGTAPIGEILAALPPGLPLSVEWSPPAGSTHTLAEWAELTCRASRVFLNQNGA
jgi:sugar phosphate isomerase/epimerase